jgi:hypothetical protein
VNPRAVVISGVRILRQQAPRLDPLSAALELTRRVAHGAEKLWTDAGLRDGERARAGVMLGSRYGTGHVDEYMRGVLDALPVPRFNPDAFVHHASNSVASRVCQQLGLGGASSVILGVRGMTDAVIAACRSLLVGRHDLVITGGFDWPSAHEQALLSRVGVAEACGAELRIVLLVVERATHAEERSAVSLAGLELLPGLTGRASGRLDVVADQLLAGKPCDVVVGGDGPSALRVSSVTERSA